MKQVKLTRRQNIRHPSCRTHNRKVKGVLVRSSREAANKVSYLLLDIVKILRSNLGETTQRERFGLEITNFRVHVRRLVGIDLEKKKEWFRERASRGIIKSLP